MGLTQKLGTIPLAVFTDSSNNVGIGAAANASYKFQVTGAANFTGDVFGLLGFFTRNSADTFIGSTNNTSGIIVNGTTLVTKIVSGGDTVATFANAGAATFSTNSNSTITNSFQNTNTTDSNTRNILNVIAGNVTTSIQSIHNDHSYINATNNIFFLSSGSIKMTMLSSGNVGIGTSSPSSIAKLDILLDATAVNGLQIRTSDAGTVDGSTTANVFRTVNSNAGNWANARYNAWDHIFTTSGSTERMRITSGGFVGIGTSSPNTTLDVNGTINVRTNGFQFGRITTNNVSGDTGGLSFQYISAGTFVEGMRINGGGNVGIGTSSPQRLLDARGAVNLSTTNPTVGSTAGAYADLHLRTFSGYPTAQAKIVVVDNWTDFYSTYTDGFRWFNWDSAGTTPVERLRISSAGRLEVKSEGIVSQRGGSNSVGGGPFLGVQQTAASGGERWILQQLNASYGLDYWAYNGSGWTAIANLSSAGVWYSIGGGTSDRRTKQNIEYINTSGIDAISLLKPVKFEFIKCPEKTRRGFIAQDVLEVIPDLVLGDGENEDGIYGLDYDGILALAVKAIQELKAEIDELKNK